LRENAAGKTNPADNPWNKRDRRGRKHQTPVRRQLAKKQGIQVIGAASSVVPDRRFATEQQQGRPSAWQTLAPCLQSFSSLTQHIHDPGVAIQNSTQKMPGIGIAIIGHTMAPFKNFGPGGRPPLSGPT
jgi:pyruvate/2-oxoglutarate dehydrogenase complex dihydrolipoamide acyltransferase (E2) component